MKLILKFLKPHWRLCIVTLLCMVADVVGALLIPTYAGEMLNEGTADGTTLNDLITTALKMAGVALLSGGGAFIGAYCCSLLTSRVATDMRKAVYKKSLSLSVSDFRTFGTASMTTRTVSDIANIQFALLSIFQMMLPVPVIFAVSLVLSFQKDWVLALILCGVLIFISILAAFIIRGASPCFKKLQRLLDNMSRILLENVTGVRVVRAFNKEEYEKDRLGKAFGEYKTTSVKANRMFAALDGISFFTVNLFVLIVYWLSGWRISAGAFGVGDIVSVIEYALMSLFYLMMAQMVILTLPRAMECSDRLGAVLNFKPQIEDVVPSPVALTDKKEVVEFKDVAFRFPDAGGYTLKGLSFSCNRGETTAIIGGTGSGKSTVASLMLRFNEATGGSVSFCGVDVRNMPQHELRDGIAYVQQKAWLFSGTVAENLRFSRPEATDEELWHALEVAQAAPFIRALPDGLNSFVAQGGTNFSGGQRQRLSIARALVKKPQLYIFDDSFSALDFKTDAALRKALAGETKNAAVVIVAQRISSIRHAEKIIVLKDGVPVGEGNHDYLMEHSDVYRDIYKSQTKSADEVENEKEE